MDPKKEAKRNDPPTETYLVREESPNRVKETHPSYGVVGISRVSGRADLFASDVVHHHFLSLRIKEAARVIDGTFEHVSGGRQLIEVWMTEAQFAQMITQPNVGDGVPCTLHDVWGDETSWNNDWGNRPAPPPPAPIIDGYKKEVEEKGAKVSEDIAKAQALVTEMLTGKKNLTKKNLDAVRDALYFAKMTADSNMPFVVERMNEAMEKKAASAVVEFETFVSQSLQARGLAYLQNDAPQLRIGPAPTVPELPASATPDTWVETTPEEPGYVD